MKIAVKYDPDLIKKLEFIGIPICSCTKFKGVQYLDYDDSVTNLVHGLGYDEEGRDNQCGINEVLHDTEYIICNCGELFLAILCNHLLPTHKFKLFFTDCNQSWVNLGIWSKKGSPELCLVDDRWHGQDPRFCNTISPAHIGSTQELVNWYNNNPDTHLYDNIH